jgi:hypothetical protein
VGQAVSPVDHFFRSLVSMRINEEGRTNKIDGTPYLVAGRKEIVTEVISSITVGVPHTQMEPRQQWRGHSNDLAAAALTDGCHSGRQSGHFKPMVLRLDELLFESGRFGAE